MDELSEKYRSFEAVVESVDSINTLDSTFYRFLRTGNEGRAMVRVPVGPYWCV